MRVGALVNWEFELFLKEEISLPGSVAEGGWAAPLPVLPTELGVSQPIEVEMRPDQKLRQGFVGSPAAAEGRKAGKSCPRLSPGRGTTWLLTRGERRVQESGRGGGLGGLPTFLGVLWAGCLCSALFCCQPFRSSGVAVGLLVFLYLIHNLPLLCTRAVIFSQRVYLYFFEETFVQGQALQQRVSDPRSQIVSVRNLDFYAFY